MNRQVITTNARAMSGAMAFVRVDAPALRGLQGFAPEPGRGDVASP